LIAEGPRSRHAEPARHEAKLLQHREPIKYQFEREMLAIPKAEHMERATFERLVAHYRVLAAELERAIEVKAKEDEK
jgi:hypothetical protein